MFNNILFVLLRDSDSSGFFIILLVIGGVVLLLRFIGKVQINNQHQREIEQKKYEDTLVTIGKLVRCSDGKARTKLEALLFEKRNSQFYKYLINRKAYQSTYLDSLSNQSIEELYNQIKEGEEREKKEKEEKLRIEQEKDKQWRNPINHVVFEINDSVESRFAGIYVIYNHNTYEFYIGSSLNMYRRKMKHLSDLKKNIHKTYQLQKAFNNDGESVFSFYALWIFETKVSKDEDDVVLTLEEQNLKYHIDKQNQNNALLVLEQEAIDRFKPTYNVYKNVYDYRAKYNNKYY